MLSFVVFLLILGCAGVNGAAIDSDSGDVSIEVPIPRGQTREEYFKSVVDYWTPERMASAQSIDPIIDDNDSEMLLFKDQQKAAGVEEVLTPTALLPGARNTRPQTAGKVYFVMNGGNYLCSGSVVNAQNQDCVLTAGHCLYDTATKKWATNWVFVPDYHLGSRPLGTWTSRRLATKTLWMNNRDFNHDVGLVLMNTNAGKHIQEQTGGLGITLSAPKVATTHAFGFPKNMGNGETMSNCVSNSLSPTFIAGFSGLQLPCAMTGGASGGPWIQQYNTNTLSGQQVSVNSFIYSTRPNNMFGPHFVENNIGTLFREWQNQ